MNFRRLFARSVTVRRYLSTEVAKVPEAVAAKPVAAAAPKAAPVVVSGGSTFFQRFSSFLTGCGVGFGVCFYFVYNELEESNAKFEQEIQAILAKVK